MKFAKTPKSTFWRWLALMLPVINWFAMWQVAKVWANMEHERGD